MIHHLMIIGEASSKMSEGTRAKYPDIPWVETIDVRNIITHEYFRLDLKIIWMIVEDNFSYLKKQIKQIVEKI